MDTISAKVSSFRDLVVWQKAMSLVLSVYELSRSFPAIEAYGLSSQIRRAAVSVPSNIAEGHARRSRREFSQFVAIAEGSLAELETQLLIAFKLGYAAHEPISGALGLTNECQKMLGALRRALARS